MTDNMMHMPAIFTKTTDSIKVSVIPTYLDEQSQPLDNLYVWAYTVQVENLSDSQVQLLNRHWEIVDSAGQKLQVDGEGVVGEQPILKPGEGFRYTSGTSLPTPSGVMLGNYLMEDATGKRFPIDVPAFSLDSPHRAERVN